MLTIVVLSFCAVLLVWIAPGLPLSRLLHEWLARRPAAWLLRLTRRQVIAATIAVILVLAGGEIVQILGSPQAVLVFAVEAATYIDALVAVVTVASLTRMQAGARWFALRRVRGARRRARRPARRAALRTPSNDDDDDDDDDDDGRAALFAAA